MVLDNKIGSVLVRATHGGEVSSSRNMLVPVPGAVRGMKSWLTGEGDVRNEGATVGLFNTIVFSDMQQLQRFMVVNIDESFIFIHHDSLYPVDSRQNHESDLQNSWN